MSEECELCVKRKTMYCPNSSECYSTEEKPFYQNRIMLLQENQQLKEQLELYENGVIYDSRVDKLESVLDEIREHIKELDDNTDDTTCYDIDRNVRDDLLQILDKVKE